MPLSPRLPAGRANRKALQYATDIHRLRHAGYTFSAIRLALIDVGVSVSLTIVKREAARKPVVAQAAQRPDAISPSPPSSPMPTSPPVPWQRSPPPPPASALPPSAAPGSLGSLAGSSSTGRQIVDAFLQGRIANPLLQQGSTK